VLEYFSFFLSVLLLFIHCEEASWWDVFCGELITVYILMQNNPTKLGKNSSVEITLRPGS
jgi:hypothetical protein